MTPTELYLVRHAQKSDIIQYSKPIKDEIEIDKARPISVLGHLQSHTISSLPFFQGIKNIYSSDYTRAVETALHLAENNSTVVNIEPAFGERIKRRDETIEIPKDYRFKQMIDSEYRLPGGESRTDVTRRFHDAASSILQSIDDKQVVIFSHKNAISMYLMKWCTYDIDSHSIIYMDNTIIETNKWNGTPEIIKITMQDGEVLDIKRIDNHL